MCTLYYVYLHAKLYGCIFTDEENSVLCGDKCRVSDVCMTCSSGVGVV